MGVLLVLPDYLVSFGSFFLDKELFVVLQQLDSSLSKGRAKLVEEVNLLSGITVLGFSDDFLVLVCWNLYYHCVILF